MNRSNVFLAGWQTGRHNFAVIIVTCEDGLDGTAEVQWWKRTRRSSFSESKLPLCERRQYESSPLTNYIYVNNIILSIALDIFTRVGW